MIFFFSFCTFSSNTMGDFSRSFLDDQRVAILCLLKGSQLFSKRFELWTKKPQIELQALQIVMNRWKIWQNFVSWTPAARLSIIKFSAQGSLLTKEGLGSWLSLGLLAFGLKSGNQLMLLSFVTRLFARLSSFFSTHSRLGQAVICLACVCGSSRFGQYCACGQITIRMITKN